MTDQSRRKFVRCSLLSLAALPLGASILSRRALAADLPRLDAADAQAQALNYVEDASQASDHPSYQDGSRCENCLHFKADIEGCALFPENSVEPAGWCMSWAK